MVTHIDGAKVMEALELEPLAAAFMATSLCGESDYDPWNGLEDFGIMAAMRVMPELKEYFAGLGDKAPDMAAVAPDMAAVRVHPVAKPVTTWCRWRGQRTSPSLRSYLHHAQVFRRPGVVSAVWRTQWLEERGLRTRPTDEQTPSLEERMWCSYLEQMVGRRKTFFQAAAATQLSGAQAP